MNTKEIPSFSPTRWKHSRTIDKEAREKVVDQIIAEKKTVREIVDSFRTRKRRRRPSQTRFVRRNPGGRDRQREKEEGFASHLASNSFRRPAQAGQGFVIHSCRFAEELSKPLPSQTFWLTRMIISTNTQPKLLRPSALKRSTISARPTQRQRAPA